MGECASLPQGFKPLYCAALWKKEVQVSFTSTNRPDGLAEALEKRLPQDVCYFAQLVTLQKIKATFLFRAPFAMLLELSRFIGFQENATPKY
jgi:hypothetical protein